MLNNKPVIKLQILKRRVLLFFLGGEGGVRIGDWPRKGSTKALIVIVSMLDGMLLLSKSVQGY